MLIQIYRKQRALLLYIIDIYFMIFSLAQITNQLLYKQSNPPKKRKKEKQKNSKIWHEIIDPHKHQNIKNDTSRSTDQLKKRRDQSMKEI